MRVRWNPSAVFEAMCHERVGYRSSPDEGVALIRALISVALAVVGNAIGLVVAASVLDGMEISGAAFVIAVLILTAVDVVIQPFLTQLAARSVAALRGATALAATLASLIVTSLVSDGLEISGLDTWLWATLIVWLVSMLAAVILPLIFLKNKVEERRA